MNSCFVTIHQMQSFDTQPDDRAKPSQAGHLLPVCPVDALPPSAPRRFTLPNGDEIAIYNIDGEFYATDNFCPHRGAALSDGAVLGHVVECSSHGWQFDVRTGECLTVTERIRTFEVRVIEGVINVAI
jgi:nitrite reductase/ring-hydroxylating ferredoxin subunit